MSQHGQFRGAPGTHPDADQLSAFMEQALPAHEREDVLAHLAVCRDCRETVAMALPPAEEVWEGAEVEHVAIAAAYVAQGAVAVAASPAVTSHAAAPKRRRTFAPWTIWAPAAAALAALALFLAYLHHMPKPAFQQQSQIAEPRSPLQPQEQPKNPAGGAPPDRAAEVNRPETPLHAKSAPASAAATAGALGEQKSLGEQQTVGSSMRQARGVAAGSGTASLPPPAPETPQVILQSQGKSTESSRDVRPLPQQEAVAPTGAPAADQTVNVATAPSSLETTSTSITAPIANASIARMEMHGATVSQPLPSRQSVLSTASYGSRMLAIDAHHTLFLSTDSGRHWKRVSGHWQGQAIEVNLVLGAEASGRAAPVASGATFDAVENRDRRLGDVPQATLTGTVTDTSGAAIPRAAVTVTDAAAKNARTVTTDNAGRYTVQVPAPGSYNVTAAAPGFVELRVGGIAVDASRTNTANLTLQVGAASQTVTVEADAAEVETAKPANKKTAAPPTDALQPPAAFEITTDAGEHWVSLDGKTWKRK